MEKYEFHTRSQCRSIDFLFFFSFSFFLEPESIVLQSVAGGIDTFMIDGFEGTRQIDFIDLILDLIYLKQSFIFGRSEILLRRNL